MGRLGQLVWESGGARLLESVENLCHQNLGCHEGRGNEDAAGGSGGAYGIRQLGSGLHPLC